MMSKFLHCERGATAVEYGLIVALIFLAILGGTGSMGQALDAMYSQKITALSTAIDQEPASENN